MKVLIQIFYRLGYTHYVRIISSVVVSIVFFNTSFSQSTVDYKLIQGLEDQWVIYNDNYKGYIPYFRKEHGVQAALSLYVDLRKYSHYNLFLQAPKETHLFVQSQLCRTLSAQSRTVVNIDSLQKQYKTRFVLITLYVPDGHSQLPTAQIVYPYKNKASQIENKEDSDVVLSGVRNSYQPKLRDLSEFPDFVTVCIVSLLAFYTFLLNYHPKAFKRNFSFNDMFSVDSREDATLIAKPLSQINILFVLAHSMSLSLFYMMAQRYSDTFFVNVLPIQLSDSFGSLFGYFALCVSIIWVLLIGKYFFIYAIGIVFGINNVASIHYYEYLLFSRIFFLIVLPLQFIFMLSFPQWLVGALKMVVIGLFIFNIIRIVTISSVLNKITSFRNLYLFSYLCATELIPLLIGIKFLAK
ncbi:DUF4271 domain-containing protein [Xanthocytophaga agilis]|uniref:DUF4271 domain-containing protein n=1 Tax=Xanthocytophaga agilis TaxID=3048010 RepID=A0AAE3UJF5_9BACT|nr:DUF4271 domain-containing protein [Xanthocytophaga agilis]MDJ1505083.1 DUF4271 domain-containing protein [Xanthocytophaga agilis]